MYRNAIKFAQFAHAKIRDVHNFFLILWILEVYDIFMSIVLFCIFSALTVRYLTKRYIGKYKSNTGN